MTLEGGTEKAAENSADTDFCIEGSEPGSKCIVNLAHLDAVINYIKARPNENFKIYYKNSRVARKIQNK